MDSLHQAENEKLKNNDKKAYYLLFKKYYAELLFIAYKYLQNEDDAKDMVQATFIKFWENQSVIDVERPVKPFLFTIHIRNCLDFIKKRKLDTRPFDPYGQNNFSQDGSPETELFSKELEYQILKAIEDLPPKCRQIFELSRFKGLKNQEIADHLNISVKTVESHITVALERLRANLSEFLTVLFFFLLQK